LFTNKAIKAAEHLIEAITEVGLELALPGSIPMHCHNVTKRWSRLDQVFISEHSENMLIACDTFADQIGINTDHLPILTELNLAANIIAERPIPNFRNVDWEVFHKTLEKNLARSAPAARLTSQLQLDSKCEELTAIIQATIQEQVPLLKITSKSKRWWTKELTLLHRKAEKLGRLAYKHKTEVSHSIHTEHKEAAKRYDKTLQYTKKQHWRDWLEKVEDPDIWTTSKLVSVPATDGGKARIPPLKHTIGGQERTARTNGEKSNALTRAFFPAKPAETDPRVELLYPPQCRKTTRLTAEQVCGQIGKLKLYKAPGPDGIPNIVLSKCADLLTPHLLNVYAYMLETGHMFQPWKCFTTVVLRKLGKPRYDLPKAYRPIALLNTMWKVITALVAEQLMHVSEKYNLLPANHFGGRPGCTTTDAMHLLLSNIKSLWRGRMVTSVLFLDIEGAFPNTVPERLVHNLHKR